MRLPIFLPDRQAPFFHRYGLSRLLQTESTVKALVSTRIFARIGRFVKEPNQIVSTYVALAKTCETRKKDQIAWDKPEFEG